MLIGATCSKADYFECIIIPVRGDQPIPMEEWSLYCVNQKTAEEKQVLLKDAIDRCLRYPEKSCQLLVTDTDEKEIIRKYYKDMCGK